MRGSNVGILVGLVWIVSGYSSFGRERKFRNNIADLGLGRLRLILATGRRRIVLRLTITSLVSRNVFSLLRIRFLNVILWNLLQAIVQLLHLLQLLLHSKLLRIRLHALQTLSLRKSSNVESLKRLASFVGRRR